MAQHPISGTDVILMIGLDGITYKNVICLTSNGITRATAEIDAASKCGPYTLPGAQTNGVSFEGQVIADPSAGNISNDDLDDYWRNKTTIYWKMGKAVPVLGDVTYLGTGFIAQLDENYGNNEAATMTGTIGVFGLIQKTTATS